MIFENSAMNGADHNPPEADQNVTQLNRAWAGGKKERAPPSQGPPLRVNYAAIF